MRPVLTAAEYRIVDQSYTGDLSMAMDRAGHGVALAAVRAGASYGKRVVVLAGPGNNGGDGYVAARYLLDRGAQVEVHALAPPRTAESQNAARLAREKGVAIRQLAEPVAADIVVDALFGGGVRGDLPEAVVAWMTTGAPVISVDIPTGLDPNTGLIEESAFVAHTTVTFSTLKTGHVRGEGPDYCGRLIVIDIGINGGEPAMFIAEGSDAIRPGRSRSTHKWSAGAVLVVGGSSGMVGASVLTGSSALNFGAGTVVVASPRADLVHQVTPQLPTLNPDQLEGSLDRFDVVVVGPGLAAADEAVVVPTLRKASKVVLDAGGLQPHLLDAAREGGADVVITPHQAEFSRVSGGLGGGAYATRAFATRHDITVLLKGNPTLITDGCPPILIDSGGPELASIGTGDVLAGMIGALWARGLQAKDAAISAAYWHGVAGFDLAKGGAVTALDLAHHVRRFAW